MNRDSLSDEVKFIIEQKFATKLGKPIFIESSVQENKSWLLDVFLDSLIDFEAVTPDDATQRYLVLEHYFSDNLLKQYNKYGKNILETEIFTISGDKNSFAAKVDSFDVLEFENFKVLFDKIEKLLSTLVV